MLAISPVEPPRPFTPIQEPIPEIVPETPWTAAKVWTVARDASLAIPLEARPFYRWVWLGNGKAPAQLETEWKVLAGHLNSLSTEPDLSPLAIIQGTGNRLLQVNLLQFGIDPKVWEKLVHEPYYHRTLDWPGGIWPSDKKSYPKGAFTYRGPAPHLAIGPGKDAVGQLTLWTGSYAPVVRGDHLLWQTAVVDGRAPGPAYYDFFGGIKTVKDFQKVIRLNSAFERHPIRRTVLWSGIVRENVRRVERDQTEFGGYHSTGDVAGVNKNRNPLDLLRDDFKPDATEQFGTLENGMPVWFLGNAKGEAQAVAPPNIVFGDRITNPTDSNLHVNLSCISCHAAMDRKERMVKNFSPLVIQELRAIDYQIIRDLERAYRRELAPRYELDRQAYETAVKQATYGMDCFTYAQALVKMYTDYDNRRVDLQAISNDTGYPAKRIQEALKRYDWRTKALPGTLSIVMNGQAIPVKLWHEFLPGLMDVLQSEGVLREE